MIAQRQRRSSGGRRCSRYPDSCRCGRLRGALCLAMPSRRGRRREPSCADRRFDAVGLRCSRLSTTPAVQPEHLGSAVLISRDTVRSSRHPLLAGANDPLPPGLAPLPRSVSARGQRRRDQLLLYPWNQPRHGVYTQVWIHEFVRPGNTSVDMLVANSKRPSTTSTPSRSRRARLGLLTSGSRALVAGWDTRGRVPPGQLVDPDGQGRPAAAQVPGCAASRSIRAPRPRASGCATRAPRPRRRVVDPAELPRLRLAGACRDVVHGSGLGAFINSKSWGSCRQPVRRGRRSLESVHAELPARLRWPAPAPADFKPQWPGRVGRPLRLHRRVVLERAWATSTCSMASDRTDLFEFLDTFFYGFQARLPVTQCLSREKLRSTRHLRPLGGRRCRWYAREIGYL